MFLSQDAAEIHHGRPRRTEVGLMKNVIHKGVTSLKPGEQPESIVKVNQTVLFEKSDTLFLPSGLHNRNQIGIHSTSRPQMTIQQHHQQFEEG
jgi:hypothetical protein